MACTQAVPGQGYPTPDWLLRQSGPLPGYTCSNIEAKESCTECLPSATVAGKTEVSGVFGGAGHAAVTVAFLVEPQPSLCRVLPIDGSPQGIYKQESALFLSG